MDVLGGMETIRFVENALILAYIYEYIIDKIMARDDMHLIAKNRGV